MMKYVGLILFSITLFFNLFSLKSFINFAETVKMNKDVYQEFMHMDDFEWCFLTLWTFVFQMIFMIVAILDETSKLMDISIDIQKFLSKTRAVMYNTLLFPSSLMVTTLFWSLYYIDRDLIFPRVLDKVFPWWLNHMLHTFIILPVIIELLLPKKYNFVKFDKAAPILLAVFSTYTVVYFSIYYRHGIWLYPVYNSMSWTQRGLFTLFQMILALTYQKIGITLQDIKRPQIRPKVK